MKAIALLLHFLLLATMSFGQDDISFVLQKIKENYPGYQEKTKGRDFEKFAKEAIEQNMPDSFKAMATIVSFFKDRHLDLFEFGQNLDTARCGENFRLTVKYLNDAKTRKKYEGYWINESGTCIIGIRQIPGKHLSYEGFVVKALSNGAAIPGMTLCLMEQRNANIFFTKLKAPRSGITSYVNAEFRSDSIMTTGPYFKWRKLRARYFEDLPPLAEPNDIATGKWLNASTFLITIPGSTAANGAVVDSLIKATPTLQSKCEHLIIDVRGNTGGTVLAYEPLYPLLYTNPIVNVASTLYPTQDDSDRMQKELEDYISNGGKDSGQINTLKYWAKFYHDSIGKFVSYPPDTITMTSVMKYPKKVSVLMDFGCQSACEMFLLNAQQSKKVKLFGEHSMGAIDYLNYYPRTTPSGKYRLYIATVRRNIQPGGSKLDGIGIKPNVQIPDSNRNWVEFVNKYYEKH